MLSLVAPSGQKDACGHEAAGVVDVTGDVFGDILVGNFNVGAGPPSISDAGAAYLYDGASGELLHTFDPPTLITKRHFGRSVVLVGNYIGDWQGHSAARVVSLFLSKVPHQAPLSLDVVGFREDAFAVTVSGAQGTSVTVEATADLRDWNPVADIVIEDGPVEVWDLEAGSKSKQLYRARATE